MSGSKYITALAIAVCSLISVVYTLIALIKKSPKHMLTGMIMFCCPVVGQVFYLGAFVCERIRKRMNTMQLEDISFSKDRRGRILAPDYDEEIQAVPLEEVLIISQNDEKRKHLLRELKKDEVQNYSMLAKALDDADTETAHYAASAISSAKTEFENNIRALDTMYSHEGGDKDMAFVRRYADYILKFLKCGILDKMETRKYSYLYISIMEKVEKPESFITTADYVNIVNEEIQLGEYQAAKEWAQKAFNANPNEEAYLMLAKVYYSTGQSEELDDIIKQLRSSDIALSGNGLELIRFFMRKPKTERATA